MRFPLLAGGESYCLADRNRQSRQNNRQNNSDLGHFQGNDFVAAPLARLFEA